MLKNIIRLTTVVSAWALMFVAGANGQTDLNADKPLRDRVAYPAKLAPVYGFPSEVEVPAPQGQSTALVPLGPLSTSAVGTQIGITTYDYQHNCTMGRQVEHRNTDYLHFDWMKQTDMIYGGNRRIGYEAYDLQTCSLVFGSGGILVTDNFAGYASLDVNSTNCPIPAAHERNYPLAYWNSCPGDAPSSTFGSDYPPDHFGWYLNSGTGPNNPNYWPKIDWQVGTATILHMVTAEFGGTADQPQTISYYRRVGAYGTGEGVWSAQRIIDTVKSINPTVVASPTTDKVALVWAAPADYKRDMPEEFASQYANDVWYAISNDQGASWMSGVGSIAHQVIARSVPGGNITQYSATSNWKAYCDLSALITSDDNLHVVWNCRRWFGTEVTYRRKSAIFHWSEDIPCIRPIVVAEWDSGGACYGYSWGSDVAKMSISECDGRLYVLFSQFGNAAQPCYDFDAAKHVMNGELYLTGSMDHGNSWDTPRNLTNSVTPNCTAGNCESDYWASMARYGRVEACGGNAGQNVLDILYINDRAAGGTVQKESGIWTTNPVMWLATPCFAIPAFIRLESNPIDVLHGMSAPPGGTCDTTITIVNRGSENAPITAGVRYRSGAGWVTRNEPGAAIVYHGCDHPVDVAIMLTAPMEEGVYEADLLYYYDNGSGPDTLIVPIRLLSSTLEFEPILSIGGAATLFAVADIDHDNAVDAIFSTPFSVDTSKEGLFVAYGLGDGVFETPIHISQRVSFKCAFINTDTLLDIVAVDGPIIEVLLNDGDRTFTSVIAAYDGIAEYEPAITVGHFNSDPYIDIAIEPDQVYYGNGHGYFSQNITLPLSFFAVDVGDFNEDGHDDLVVLSGDSALILLSYGNEGFSRSGALYTYGGSEVLTTGDALADFDRDGHLDFALAINFVDDTSYTFVALGDGSGGIKESHYFAREGGSWKMGLADFDRDRRLDIVLCQYDPAFDNVFLNIYLGDGQGHFNGPIIVDQTPPFISWGVGIGDFDRDGNPDLMAASTYIPDRMRVYLNLMPDAPVLPDEMTTTGYNNVSLTVQNPYSFYVSRYFSTVGGSAYWRYNADADSTLDESAVDYNLMYGEYRIAIGARPGTTPGALFSAIIMIDGTQQAHMFINYNAPSSSKYAKDGRLTSDSIIFYYTVDSVSSIQPPNGQEVFNRRPIFDWSRLVSGAPADSFQFQLDRYYDFSGIPIIIDAGELVAPTYTPAAELGMDSVFYWRMRTCAGGVWSDFSRIFAVYVRGYKPGDANGDAAVNVGDVVYIINYIFRKGPKPTPKDAGDANCDHFVNIGDAVYIFNYFAKGGPAPGCP